MTSGKSRRTEVYNSSSIQSLRTIIEKELTERNILPSSKDSKILIKPNFNSNMNALTGNTTDLRLIGVVLEYLKECGYTNIVIGEGTSSGFYRNKIDIFARLKVDRLAEKFDVELLDLNYSSSDEVEFKDDIAKVASICKEVDLFINMPKLKMHFETTMSVSLKNLIGCLSGLENKQKVHYSLYKNIIKLNEYLKPDIHIVDGLISMEGTGPSLGTPIKTNVIVVGQNPYLVDLVCARIAGVHYDEVPVLKIAKDEGLISQNEIDYTNNIDFPSEFEFKRPSPSLLARLVNNQRWQKYFIKIRLAPILGKVFELDSVGNLLNLTGLRQDVFIQEDDSIENLEPSDKCESCDSTVCEIYCPTSLELPDNIGDEEEGCISCLYCYFICPKDGVHIEGNLGFINEQLRQYDQDIRSLEE